MSGSLERSNTVDWLFGCATMPEHHELPQDRRANQLELPTEPPKLLEEVVILVNPASGGGQAAAYLAEFGEDGSPTVVSLAGAKCCDSVSVRAFNMRQGQSGRKPGCLWVKQFSEQARRPLVRVMVAGGDGTVAWVLIELIKTGVDMRGVAVGHIPFGTGNDFSRSTGWGPGAPPDPIGRGQEILQRDLGLWVYADIVDFDVWEVSITTTATGGFSFVHGQELKLTEDDKEQHSLLALEGGGWRMRKPMLNYFSLGSCCRAGVGFEQNRTQSRMGNNAVYAWQGLKALTLQPAPLVSDVVEELAIAAGGHAQGEWLQGARIGFGGGVDQGVVTRLAGRSAELMFLNVPSFAGGANPWAWAVRDTSSQASAAKPAPAKIQAERLEDLWAHTRAEAKADAEAEMRALVSPDDCDQNFGDGRLEVLAYSTGIGAATDAANSKVWIPGRGNGQRLASAHGPFVASFKPPTEAQYTSKDGQVYFQVDGEFFIAIEPQQAVVRHWQTVRVLRNGKRCR